MSLHYIMFQCIEYEGKGRMMLRFRGRDYRRSSGSTWYDRIDSFLTSFGFTKSKVDSNLYYKVEDKSKYDLFLTDD